MTKKKPTAHAAMNLPKLVAADREEIIADVAHFADRDQLFQAIATGESGERWIGGAEEDRMRGTQDEDEGDTGVVSDPAYEREGDSRVLRSSLGDRSVEEHMSPAARAGNGGGDDPRGVQHLSIAELRQRARALSIPGRSKMTKSQLSAAVHVASQPQ